MASSLAVDAVDVSENGTGRFPSEPHSQVRAAPLEARFLDPRDEELESADAPTEEGYLSDPALDFASFIGQRWSLSDDAAQELLCDWLRDYQPQRDYSDALGAQRAAES